MSSRGDKTLATVGFCPGGARADDEGSHKTIKITRRRRVSTSGSREDFAPTPTLWQLIGQSPWTSVLDRHNLITFLAARPGPFLQRGQMFLTLPAPSRTGSHRSVTKAELVAHGLGHTSARVCTAAPTTCTGTSVGTMLLSSSPHKATRPRPSRDNPCSPLPPPALEVSQ